MVLEKLKIGNKRSIPENDIGFAIIFSNTTKHCNANFNVSLVNLESQSNVIKSQDSIVLAPETQVLQSCSFIHTKIIIIGIFFYISGFNC